MATFVINGTYINSAVVNDNGGTTEFNATIRGDWYDTTNTVSLRDLSRGDEIILSNFKCNGTFHGGVVNQYTSVNLTVWDQTGQTIEYGHYLYADTATDYIILQDLYENDTVPVQTVYRTHEHGYSLSEPSPSYATGFELDGYSTSDVIYTPLDVTTTIGINLLPSGSAAYNPFIGISTAGLLNANSGYDYDTGRMWVELTGFEAGHTSIDLGLDLEDGTQYWQTYNVTVTVPATDFSIKGVAQGGTISARQGGNAKDYTVQFSPSGGVPTTFAVSSSNTSVATATYANGKITITPIATGNSTLTATMNAGLGSEKVYTYTIAVNPPISNKALGGNAIAFLKAKIAEGGGFTKLTEADYNATDQEGNPCLYLGNLELGCYVIDSEDGYIYAINQNDDTQVRWYIGGYLFVAEWPNPWNPGETNKQVFSMTPAGDITKYSYYTYDGDWNTNGQAMFATGSDVSAQISSVAGQLWEQPTTDTWGSVGAIYRFTQDVTDPDTSEWLGQTAELWFCAGVQNDPSTGMQTFDWVKLYPTT